MGEADRHGSIVRVPTAARTSRKRRSTGVPGRRAADGHPLRAVDYFVHPTFYDTDQRRPRPRRRSASAARSSPTTSPASSTSSSTPRPPVDRHGLSAKPAAARPGGALYRLCSRFRSPDSEASCDVPLQQLRSSSCSRPSGRRCSRRSSRGGSCGSRACRRRRSRSCSRGISGRSRATAARRRGSPRRRPRAGSDLLARRERLAFTGEYDGNVDVFVVAASGGSPRRLTWHPGADQAVGFSGDGKKVLFRSGRDAYADFSRLFTVPLEGGFPEPLPMWRAEEGSFSPDGSRIAYVPNMQWQKAWKRYRGGQTTPVQIVRLSDLELVEIPRPGSNDSNPMWIGDRVYFLSDRNGPVTLFAFDTRTSAVTEEIENRGFDFKSASAGPGAIVYEQFGSLHLFDLATGTSRRVDVEVEGDLPASRRHFEKVADQIQAGALSPKGVRVAFEAHGEILTVPAEKGDIRNLTSSPAAADRDPAWSPDGQRIAYFSDESGEYQLHIRSQGGLGEVGKIDLGSPPSFFYSPLWSPDGKKIAFTDKRRNLWYVEIDKGVPVKVASDRYEDFFRGIDPSWSPDSRFLAYTAQLSNHMRSVFVYSLEAGKSTQLTDGMSDARFPAFDPKGELLYFTASTDYGLSVGWLDLSSAERPVRRNLYAAVLRKDSPSPLAPESDEEGSQPEKKDEEGRGAPARRAHRRRRRCPRSSPSTSTGSARIVPLPVPARNYGRRGGEDRRGVPAGAGPNPSPRRPPRPAIRFRLEDREAGKISRTYADRLGARSGEKMLVRSGGLVALAGSEGRRGRRASR